MIVNSLRHYGGMFSTSPIWIVFEDPDDMVVQIIKNVLDKNIHFVTITQEKEDFPFLKYVKAAAAIEKEVKFQVKNLVWLDAKTVILDEPLQFLLPSGKKLGYRPVHHKLVGSSFDQPADDFWKSLYDLLGVEESKIFPMKTHIDDQVIRPYMNAGCIVLDPKYGIFKKWEKKYRELYSHDLFKPLYQKFPIYKIFMHQAVLTTVVLTKLSKDEMIELPPSYNYPLHLYDQATCESRFSDIEELITVRFEDIKDLQRFKLQFTW